MGGACGARRSLEGVGVAPRAPAEEARAWPEAAVGGAIACVEVRRRWGPASAAPRSLHAAAAAAPGSFLALQALSPSRTQPW